MEIIFLGTFPTKSRNVSATVIKQRQKKVTQFAEHTQLKNLILTHFSARYQYAHNKGASIKEVEEEARQYYQGELFLANDFDRFHLDKDGQLSLLEQT